MTNHPLMTPEFVRTPTRAIVLGALYIQGFDGQSSPWFS